MSRMMVDVKELNDKLSHLSAEEVVAYFVENYGGEIALASSLSIEDQALTHMIRSVDSDGLKCRIFTLDTGRLFPETYSLISKTSAHYGVPLEIYFPQSDAVEEMVSRDGINLFYDSVEKRRKCCEVRKIEPLRRAFTGLRVWICGLRQQQSVTRGEVNVVEWDAGNSILKINPLAMWSEEQVWDYIHARSVPYNPLHERGFLSIGCQPCTRAVGEGEDIRAGRWWWENPEQKECGLHR